MIQSKSKDIWQSWHQHCHMFIAREKYGIAPDRRHVIGSNLFDKDQKRILNRKGIDHIKQKIEHVSLPELNNLG